MPKIKVMDERPITLAEVKVILKKNERPLSKGVSTLEYLKKIPILKEDKAKELIEKLKKLEITRLKDKHIVKIVDIMPKDMDSLKMLLSEDISLKQEELQKILDTIKKA